MPSKTEIRNIKKQDVCDAWGTADPGGPPSASSSRPMQSTRKGLRKTAMMLSVLLTTTFSAMCGAAQTALPTKVMPETAILEVGGLTATCRLAEYDICDHHLWSQC